MNTIRFLESDAKRLCPAMLAALLLATPVPARAGITWDWNYLNPDKFPAGARQALVKIGKTLDNWFSITNDVTIKVDVKAFFKPKGALGGASSPSVSDDPGFHHTVMMHLALTGEDTNGDAAEGSVDMNFTPGYAWAYGDDVPDTKMDFTSTMLHELLHCLGFAGDISPENAEKKNKSWTVFDRFMTDKNGAAIVFPAGAGANSYLINPLRVPDLTGNPGMYFSGPKALQSNGGKRVAIYSPDPWNEGSSGSHPDTSFAPSLMQYDGGGGGRECRTMHRAESGIMQDIGYTLRGNAEFASPKQKAAEPSGVDALTGLRRAATSLVPVVIIRHGDISGTGSVDYCTIAQTGKGFATEGEDYLAASGTLFFAAGVMSNIFELVVLSNTNAGSTVEDVQIILSNPRGVILGAVTNFTLQILDEEDGARQTVFFENFDSGALPDGWSVLNLAEGPGWGFDNPAARSNMTGGSAGFILADSASAGAVDIETELYTPAMYLGNFDFVTLKFNLDFNYAPLCEDVLCVEVSTNGAAGPWEPVWDAPDLSYPKPSFASFAELTNAVITPARSGNFRGPRAIEIDLTDEAAGCSNVMLRFVYYDANAAGWVEMDNVRVFGNIDYEVADEDSNGNGLPDWWEELYFDDPSGITAEGDPDADGYTNLQEFIAGTDPTDAESKPEIEELYAEDRSQVAVFFGEPGCSYMLAYSNRFTQGWVPVNAAPVLGQGDYIVLTNASSLNNDYRLAVSIEGKGGPVYSAIKYIQGLPVPMDFDADRYPDLTVYDEAGATWYCLRSSDGGMSAIPWGWPGACPLAGDFDGDGTADLAVYDRDNGLWYIASLTSVQSSVSNIQNPRSHNTDNRKPNSTPPAPGTPNTDHRSPITSPLSLNTEHCTLNTAPLSVLAWAVPWGFPGAIPAPADYDGDGAADLAVYDPASGDWYIASLTSVQSSVSSIQTSKSPNTDNRKPNTSSPAHVSLNTEHCTLNAAPLSVLAWGIPWGFPGATPVPGDYDGDGATDLAVFDPASGEWYIASLTSVQSSVSSIQTSKSPDTDNRKPYSTPPAPGTPNTDHRSPIAGSPRVIAWAVPWGFPGAVPVPGDYDGDGCSDLGVYDEGACQWYVASLDSMCRAASGERQKGGVQGSALVKATTTDKSGFRVQERIGVQSSVSSIQTSKSPNTDHRSPITSALSLNTKHCTLNTAALRVIAWGVEWGFTGATAVPGDFDGDETADLALYYQPSGSWYILSLARGVLAMGQAWGFDQAVPVAPQVQINRLSP